jgi:NADPH-dependent glutamate synthase beta subunit-like oxidoreductase
MTAEELLAFRIPLFFSRSTTTTEDNRTGDWSYVQPSYRDHTAPCSEACPCGTDIPRVERLAAQGRFREAWQAILMENPLPGICGRVCYHPCEGACNRGGFDAPVAVHLLERALADQAGQDRTDPGSGRRPATGRRVAILGSGPAGLAAASFLARLGHACEIFEREPEPGGVLRWGIPTYRLPAEALAREVDAVRALGVRIHCGVAGDLGLAERFDAVLVACGYGQSMGLGVPGADLAEDGLAFLRAVRAGTARPAASGARVAVIGGGNTAIDVARTLLRRGQHPLLVYRRRLEDMPAFFPEVQRALAEGVEVMQLYAPVALARDGAGLLLTVQGMRSLPAGPDGRAGIAPRSEPPVALPVAAVYAAVGSEATPEWRRGIEERSFQRHGRTLLACDGPRLLAVAGDLGTGPRDPKNVSEAIGSGKEAALALDICLRSGAEAVAGELAACRVGGGPSLSMEVYLGGPRARRSGRVVRFDDLNPAYFTPRERFRPPVLEPRESLGSFAEVEGGLDPEAAVGEAERCFTCGQCNDCDNCRTFCPEVAVRVDGRGRRDIAVDFCKGCGVCVEECPRGAMVLGEEGRP